MQVGAGPWLSLSDRGLVTGPRPTSRPGSSEAEGVATLAPELLRENTNRGCQRRLARRGGRALPAGGRAQCGGTALVLTLPASVLRTRPCLRCAGHTRARTLHTT